MNQIKEIILNKIKESKLGVGHVLPTRVLQTLFLEVLNPKQQESFNASVDELVNESYLSEKNGGLELLQKGYDHIFKDYTLEDTERLILHILEDSKIGRGHSIPLRIFFERQVDWERYFADTLEMAIQSLITKGIFTEDGQNLFLSDLGFEKVYEFK